MVGNGSGQRARMARPSRSRAARKELQALSTSSNAARTMWEGSSLRPSM